MTEKNIFVNKLFIREIFQIFVYFLNCNPPRKSHPLFSSNPPLKIEILSSPSPFFFENLVGGSTPSLTRSVERMQGEGGGVQIMGAYAIDWDFILKLSIYEPIYLSHYISSKNG